MDQMLYGSVFIMHVLRVISSASLVFFPRRGSYIYFRMGGENYRFRLIKSSTEIGRVISLHS